MPKDETVERPTKRTEHRIVFATRQAQRGWRDLRATALNAMADAWDALTRDPEANNPTCHPLRGDLGTITVDGVAHVRRQYELPGGARIWFYVTPGRPGTVHLTDVHTHHPNATK
ncbi:MAG: hypothetical protein FWD18_01365 [Micrococcales bacterium]|nr:hypothetical protein [Micrococcales bacterium]